MESGRSKPPVQLVGATAVREEVVPPPPAGQRTKWDPVAFERFVEETAGHVHQLENRLEALKTHIDERFAALEKKIDERANGTDAKLDKLLGVFGMGPGEVG